MKHFILAPLAALFGVLAVNSSLFAQFTYPLQGAQRYPGWQTPQSPYLNLLRGWLPVANYYSGVLPEFQRRQDRGAIYSNLQGLNQRLPARPGAIERDIDTPLGSTGHPTQFGYTGSYFGGPTGIGRQTSNPFPSRQTGRQAGPKNKWPRTNTPQPAGQPPKKPA